MQFDETGNNPKILRESVFVPQPGIPLQEAYAGITTRMDELDAELREAGQDVHSRYYVAHPGQLGEDGRIVPGTVARIPSPSQPMRTGIDHRLDNINPAAMMGVNVRVFNRGESQARALLLFALLSDSENACVISAGGKGLYIFLGQRLVVGTIAMSDTETKIDPLKTHRHVDIMRYYARRLVVAAHLRELSDLQYVKNRISGYKAPMKLSDIIFKIVSPSMASDYNFIEAVVHAVTHWANLSVFNRITILNPEQLSMLVEFLAEYDVSLEPVALSQMAAVVGWDNFIISASAARQRGFSQRTHELHQTISMTGNVQSKIIEQAI
ncbi:MAG: hypothetical protein NC924_08295 [Candidatus Omnitrophica bacterium]|nr:hypothetical protein [Candidatus Omnitrophota bacterium]